MRHEFVTEDTARCPDHMAEVAEGVVVARATQTRTIGSISRTWVSMWVVHWPSCCGRSWVGTTR